MPFDGFGNFLRLYSWVVDATNSVKIRADRHDDEDNNFTAGLSNCIAKDGQSIISQNIPWNSRRITALADPVDPQDASTKAYADTKASLAGGATFTSDVVLKEATPSLTLDGTAGNKNSIYGQKSDKNRWEIVLGNAVTETGSDTGSDFQLLKYADDGTTASGVLYGYRSTGLVVVAADPTAAMGIATKQYVDVTVTSATSNKLPLAGGTITGSLQVNGEVGVLSNVFRFGAIGSSPGYIQWQGGSSYVLGGAGTIWHSGNFNPASSSLVSNARLAFAGDRFISADMGGPPNPVPEPFTGAVMTGVGADALAYMGRFRYLQLFTTGWFTVSYA